MSINDESFEYLFGLLYYQTAMFSASVLVLKRLKFKTIYVGSVFKKRDKNIKHFCSTKTR